MIKHWASHAEYQQFVFDAVSHLNGAQLKKLSSYADSMDKLTSLNLDPVGLHLFPFYSDTGRPALNQPQILRSFVLMMDLGELSLTNWVNQLLFDDILALMIGCSPASLPPLGSYYDFIDRLWLRNPEYEKLGREDLFPPDKNKKPSAKLGKGKKLPNRHSGITKKIAAHALSDRDFPFHYEKLLQELFSIAAIVPSMALGLIPSDGITASGDGTCVHAHSSSYGHKVCDCLEQGISDCTCDRHFSDPDAAWGWDSDLNCYYFGHTLYMLSYHDERHQMDLPLHIRFMDARRHDSVSGIVSLAEFRTINPGFSIINLCLDSAHDNYPTYHLCKEWDIQPFIDLNSNRGRPTSIPQRLNIDNDGTPLCPAGFRMTHWGYSPSRHDCKWRCPVACGKEETCTCEVPCSSSPYGRCVYTKPDWDIRLYTPIARGTQEYIHIYNNRSGSERVNNRILNDYHLHAMIIHGKKRYSFFAMIAGINVHLDARLKKMKMDAAA